jgi:hypothetical protein
MNYVGVDLHKNYSLLCAVDEEGGRVREARIEGNAAEGFARFSRVWKQKGRFFSCIRGARRTLYRPRPRSPLSRENRASRRASGACCARR